MAAIHLLLFKLKMKEFPKRDKPRSHMYTSKNKVGKVPPMTFQVPSALTSLPTLEISALLFQKVSVKAWSSDTNPNIAADLHSWLFNLWVVLLPCRACGNYHSFSQQIFYPSVPANSQNVSRVKSPNNVKETTHLHVE